jgi:hypothetical protein
VSKAVKNGVASMPFKLSTAPGTTYPVYRLSRSQHDQQHIVCRDRDARPRVVSLRRQRPQNAYRYVGAMMFVNGEVIVAFVRPENTKRLLGVALSVFEDYSQLMCWRRALRGLCRGLRSLYSRMTPRYRRAPPSLLEEEPKKDSV